MPLKILIALAMVNKYPVAAHRGSLSKTSELVLKRPAALQDQDLIQSKEAVTEVT